MSLQRRSGKTLLLVILRVLAAYPGSPRSLLYCFLGSLSSRGASLCCSVFCLLCDVLWICCALVVLVSRGISLFCGVWLPRRSSPHLPLLACSIFSCPPWASMRDFRQDPNVLIIPREWEFRCSPRSPWRVFRLFRALCRDPDSYSVTGAKLVVLLGTGVELGEDRRGKELLVGEWLPKEPTTLTYLLALVSSTLFPLQHAALASWKHALPQQNTSVAITGGEREPLRVTNLEDRTCPHRSCRVRSAIVSVRSCELAQLSRAPPLARPGPSLGWRRSRGRGAELTRPCAARRSELVTAGTEHRRSLQKAGSASGDPKEQSGDTGPRGGTGEGRRA
ncbi:hypothetical protein NDU88_004749 [Pleurodeles waltl]|uniref:Uncharacterized protein n=1 Tax=Pleurodeles waltl TaxID=8319 RepID=A0AAV7LJA5_PLEWA|nr:hypothetical protein NDU88_004749 [Pleurodeles waltl]